MSKSKKSAKRAKRKPVALPPGGGFVVVANLKGGSGKSTIAFNLAAWLARHGARPALVDLDPQKTLTDLVAVRREMEISPDLPAPSDRLDGTPAPGTWTVVDVGAADRDGMAAAIARADLVLVPVLPGQADVWATERHLAAIDGGRPDHCAVRMFLNRADPGEVGRETREALEALALLARMRRSAALLPTSLTRRVAFCRSLSEGRAVFELDAASKASAEFEALAGAILADRAVFPPSSPRAEAS